MKEYQTQVCIVGAGPSGMVTAFHLARQGIQCILLDKGGRIGSRGEIFDGRVIHAIRRLNSGWLEEMKSRGIFLENWDTEFQSEGLGSFRVSFSKGETPRWLVDRRQFDDFLKDKLKCEEVESLTRCTAVSFAISDEGVSVSTQNGVTIQAQLLIDSSGCLSRLTPQIVDRPKVDEHIWYNQTFSLRQKGPQRSILINAMHDLGVWLVACPLSADRMSVGIGLRKCQLEKGKNLSALFQIALDRLSQSHSLFQGLELFDNHKAQGSVVHLTRRMPILFGERFLLTGSAAYSLNPVTGFGVGHALHSAELAAQTAIDAVRKDDFSTQALKPYQRNMVRTLGTEFRLSRWVTVVLRYPKLFVPMVFLFGRFVEVIITRPAFTRDFWKPSFYWKIMFQR